MISGDRAVRPVDTTRASGVRPGARAVIGGDHGAVRRGDRRDLACEEAIGDGLLGAVLAADAPFVLTSPGDATQRRDVLGGLTHREVDVGHQPQTCLLY